ncbi:unnamed protein product [Ambrosiozyma monospora]|uniref:Carnitine O-acetyltransferase, mitochondrial n=1 Tax=Ambrosiozyma monospora TaxID=43982 RepID=A0A9W6YY30_AMBMO|nr:unnamed protein product [Ambrosiozyma monospora]
MTVSTRFIHSSSSMAAPVKKKGDMYKHQDELPPLPVPSLKQTLDTYKKSIIPYYPKGEKDPHFLKYGKVIDDFAKTQGPKLQERLEKYAVGKRNWLSDYWDNLAYLEYRDPVCPFVSYFYAHKDINTVIGKDQLLKAACLTSETLKFMESIENESLEPDVLKGTPFCMESFKWMFNNARIPNQIRDLSPRFEPKENRFMVVISNGHFYKFYHHNLETDTILSLNDIYAGLASIQQASHNQPAPKNPIGVLSSSHRDKWAENYQELIKNPINRLSLHDLASSSFVLCLDDTFPNTFEERFRTMWHGNGINRWYDKPVELFVTRNAVSGFLGEHSRMDGSPTARMNDHIVNQVSKMTLEDFGSADESLNTPILFEHLKFEVNAKIEKEISQELVTFKNTVDSLDIKVWHHFGLGKKQIKQFKVSPDAFMQMMFQLAYFKYTGTLRPTYEPASTKRCFNGRTETCRSVSPESLKFVKLWENPSVSREKRVAAFRDAVKAHIEYVGKASMGYGCDRHMFGLRQMLQPEETQHEFFTDPINNYSSHWYVSTSNLSSDQFIGWGWSPVVPEE